MFRLLLNCVQAALNLATASLVTVSMASLEKTGLISITLLKVACVGEWNNFTVYLDASNNRRFKTASVFLAQSGKLEYNLITFPGIVTIFRDGI